MTITDTDLKNLREWSSKVDDENTPIFIKKEFEEKIQYLFDSKGGSINFLENRAASMSNRLSSVVNQIVNLTGFLRAPSTLITVAVKTGKPIQATRVFLKELINASQEAKTILKGRVSRGTSFDDAVGAASGPRVRYLEQGKGKFLGGKFLGKPLYLEIGGKKVDLNPINLGYSKIKYIPRLLESADTMASGAISGVTQFRAATKEINKYFPELSAAEKSQKVYDIMYSGDIAAETTKAIRDLKNSGVSEPTIAEINRTVNERVERARNERLAQEFYKQVESLNDISETKLKADGIANPTKEEILAESYKTLGATEAADIVARGERQAARETGKMSTVGITSIILLPVDMIQKKLNQGVKNKSKAVSTLSEAGDVAFSITFPFANSIARWAEMGAELFTPYGLLKGTGYKIAAKFTSKDSKIPAEEYSELGDDYFIRGIQGAAITVTIMYGVALLNKIDDDEEIEKLGKSFTGTAKEKQYAQERVESVGKPKQTVNIRGTNIPLAFLGSQGLVIGMWADYLKLKGESKLDNNMQERGVLYISSLAAMQAFGSYIFDATYLSSAKKYGSAASSLVEMKEEGYAPTLGRLAGGIISSQIPFNRLQVEAATLYNPKSQSSKEFGSNLLAQMSIVRAFQSGKPNFDYRGREYDYGDIYANSADGVRKMFGKAKYGDKIDAFLSEINFAATDAYRETRDEDNYKFSITNPDYTHRFMTNDEYYEFKRKTANKFNEQITAKYEEINRRVDKVSNPERYDLDGIKKKIVSELLSEAKDEAFEEVQNSIFKPSKAKLSRAKNKEEAISEKVSSLVRKFKKK